MPRFKNYSDVLSSERIARAQRYRVRGYKPFNDPFPFIHGTLPEKMVYAELSRRGFRFLFLNDIRFEIPEIDLIKEYQADFVIPDLRIIIEVNGAYWHSKQKTIEEDAMKYAIYQTAGYKILAWWDFDILYNLNKLFNDEPLLRGTFTHSSASGELTPIKRTKIDTSKGIRTLNRKRADRLSYKKKSVRIKTRRTRNYRYKTNG